MFRTRQPKRLLGLAWLVLAGALSAQVAAGCSALIKPPPPSAGGTTSGARKIARDSNPPSKRSSGKRDDHVTCPDLGDRDAVGNVDWANDFGLDDDQAQILTGALIAAAGMQALSTKLDSEIKTACAGITRELGGRAVGDSTETACAAAVRSINDTRARLGSRAIFNVAYVAPHCGLPADALSACLRVCSGDGGRGKTSAPLDCPAASSAGVCDGDCDGSCDAPEGIVCDGKCMGGCDWGFRGTCDGTCVGTCNGHASRGSCTGRCVGQCFGFARHGTCDGRCLGPCVLRRPAPCAGQCAGRCSTAWKALQCDAVPKSAPGAAACGPSCEIDTAVSARCTSARVSVTIDKVHGRDHARAQHLAKVLARFLPAILRVSVGMKARAAAFTRAGEAAFRAGEDLISGASGDNRAPSLSSCAGGPLRGGLAAMSRINVSVRVAVEVKTATDSSSIAGGHRRG